MGRGTYEGMILWSPKREQYEHWNGGVCTATSTSLSQLKRRFPRALVSVRKERRGHP